jgi:hypothetical protein
MQAIIREEYKVKLGYDFEDDERGIGSMGAIVFNHKTNHAQIEDIVFD